MIPTTTTGAAATPSATAGCKPVQVTPRKAVVTRTREELEAYELNGYRLSIVVDPDPSSPREWDNLGTMACWHCRYTLGDEQPKETATEFLANLPEGTITLPLYLYDHSGLAIRTSPFSCPWDSGQVGHIYATPAKLKEEYEGYYPPSEWPDRARKVMEGEVKTYNDFLSGSVYGYVIEDSSGKHIDSCWGFFGLDFCREEALDILTYQAKGKG